MVINCIEPQDKWILSAYDRTPAMAINTEGTLCQSRDAAWAGGRATKGLLNKGKYYYEATVSDEGLCRVGWSLNEVSQNFCFHLFINFFSHCTFTLLFDRHPWILVQIATDMALVARAKNLTTDSSMIMALPMG